MLEKDQINLRQMFILVFLVTIGDLVLILPPILAAEAKQDAWIAGILGIALGMMIVILFSAIAKRLPHTTLIESLQQVFGRWIGIPIGVLLLINIMLSISSYTRVIGNFMIMNMLPETPIQFIHFMFLSLVVLAVRLGIRTFTEVAELFFAWFVFGFILFVCFVLPHAETEYYLPVMEHGIKPVLRSALPALVFPYTELIVFLMILPNIKQSQHIRRPFILGSLLGGAVIVILTHLGILVLGADMMTRNVYPVYSLARKINIGEVLQRVEVLFTSLWLITTFIKMTLYFYALNIGMGQLLKLKQYRMITLPNVLIISVLAIIIAPNSTYFFEMVAKYWPFYDLTYGVLLPASLLLVYALRKRLKVVKDGGNDLQ